MKPFEDNDMEMNEMTGNLANARQAATYTVPPGYFDDLADEVMSKINVPAGLPVPLSEVPPQYFDTLSEKILSNIKMAATTRDTDVQQELTYINPLFASIPKYNVYKVPQGYFETLHVTPVVAAEHTVETPASVQLLRRPAAAWLTYAAAAVVMGVLAIGILFTTKNTNPAGNGQAYTFTTNYKEALSNVPDSEITEYLSQPSPDADLVTNTQDNNLPASENQSLFRLLLNKVSDNEIQNYLKENDERNEKEIKGI